MATGDVISVACTRGIIVFRHFGIDLGDGTIVHLATESDGKSMSVQRVPFEQFSVGKPIRIEQEVGESLAKDLVAERALQAVGKSGYHLIWDNCEHFAREMKTGVARSHQVEDAIKSVVRGTLAGISCFLGRQSLAKSVTVLSNARVAMSAGALVPTVIGETVRCSSYTIARSLNVDHEKAHRSSRQAAYAATAIGGFVVGGPVGSVSALAVALVSDRITDKLDPAWKPLVQRRKSSELDS
jgi:hypothetical protein